MAYPIKYFSLQKAELKYEVELRGGSGESVQELRKQIIKLSPLLPPEDILESHLDPTDDLKEVRESLLKSQNNLAALQKQFDKSLFNRTEALLHHIYHRINRFEASSDLTEISSNFKAQFNELASYKQTASQVSQPNTFTTTTENAPGPSAISVTCDRSLYADINKLKFSGQSCVHSFIQRVDEYVQSRGIPFDKILSLAFEIFVDDALHWYRYNKDRVSTWQELCVLLKEDFSSSDYDYRLAAEIRSRTQGDQENITVYLSIMHGMFSRLNKPISEDDKLEILIHNIRPCYATTLAASPCIKTIEELRTVCRSYENIVSRFSQFQEPPRVTNNTLAPEFAYKYKTTYTSNNNKYNEKYKNNSYNKQNNYSNFNTYKSYNNNSNNNKVNSIEVAQTIDNEVFAINQEPSRPVYCPRCRSNSHSLRNCRQPRFLICFKCGKKDVRYPDCTNCNPADSKRETSKN